jgi:glycosyltransferase involved in cell wall biosynthesis
LRSFSLSTLFILTKSPIQVLQVCKKIPWPLKDGEAIAITHLSQALVTEGIRIDLISMNTSKHFVKPDGIEKVLSHYDKITVVPVDNRLKISGLIWNFFQKASYHISRFQTPEFENALIEMLKAKEYDIIQLESLVLAAYIPIIRKNSKAKIVLRSHNVEYLIWKRLSETESNPIKKFYLNLAASKLKKFELKTLKEIDMLVPISNDDNRFFRSMGYVGPSHTCPIIPQENNNTSEMKSHPMHPFPYLTFIGTLDWLPNQEGLKWFLKNVWPEVLAQYPGARIDIAGRKAPAWLQAIKIQGVTFVGEVEDAAEFLSRSLLTLVPLLSGSGMRAKIIEALSLGHLVFSTKIGAEGIPILDGEHFLSFHDSKSFMKSLDRCFSDPGFAEKIASNGYSWVHTEFNPEKISRELVNAYEALLLEKAV